MNWGQKPVKLVTKVATGMSKRRARKQNELFERERLATDERSVRPLASPGPLAGNG